MDPLLPGGVLVGLVALERGVELVVSRRNLAWSLARGGFERGRGHWPAMVALHAGLLLGSGLEPVLRGAPAPWTLSLAMTALVAAAQALRWWCIATLGARWCARVVVVPGLPLVRGGPYRWLRHPNYLAVALEGLALPLATGAWLTALGFGLLNALLLRARIRCEEAALAEALAASPAPAGAGA